MLRDARQPWPVPRLHLGDSCPDNCLVFDAQVWLLDFEWAEIRHALIDGAFPWIHVPSCWCVNRLPDDLPDLLVGIYWSRLAEGIPEAAEDRHFHDGLVAASVVGFASNTCSDVFESDRRWGISTLRQRNLLRVRIFERTAGAHGYPAIADACGTLGEQIDTRWSDVEPMPIYPAFR